MYGGEDMVSLVVIDYKSAERTVRFIKEFYDNLVYEDKANITVVDNSMDEDNYTALVEGAVELDLLSIPQDIKDRINRESVQTARIERAVMLNGTRGSVLIIKSNENGGCPKGNNTGAVAAYQIFRDKYTIFSNSDLFFEKPFDLELITRPMEVLPDVGITGPRVVGLDGKRQSPHRKLGIWKMHIFPYLFWPVMSVVNRIADRENIFTSMDLRDESGYAYRVMGSFMAVNTKEFFDVGMFDENVFIYGEEMVLAEKMEGIGKRAYYVNECEIRHEHGATTKKSFSNIKTQRLKFDADLYYQQNYMGASSLEVFLAKLGFGMYERIYFPFKSLLKKES